MDASLPLAAAKLVQVHKARDETEGNYLVGCLRDNGIEAVMRLPPSIPPYDFVEWMCRNNKIDGIFVREPDADRARKLIQEFLTTATDAPSLEALAAKRPPLTKEKIGQLRGALREERRTFQFLAWLALTVAFLATVCFGIGNPLPRLGWSTLAMLVLLAMLVGHLLRKQ